MDAMDIESLAYNLLDFHENTLANFHINSLLPTMLEQWAAVVARGEGYDVKALIAMLTSLLQSRVPGFVTVDPSRFGSGGSM